MANPFSSTYHPVAQNGNARSNSIPGLPEVDRSLSFEDAYAKFASELQGNPQQIAMNLMMNGLLKQADINQLSNMIPFIKGRFNRF